MRTEIGKIQQAGVGFGGYQDAMVGVSFTLGSDKSGWGVQDFWGGWAMPRTERCQWTEAERLTALGETLMRLAQLLEAAKVTQVEQLVGRPVEATFDGNLLKSWRILTEVV